MRGYNTVKKNRLRNVALALLAVATVFALPAQSLAATSGTAAPTTTSDALKISPVRSDITVNAGASGTVKIILTNTTSSPLNLKPIENDFIAGDEKGTPAIILDPNSYAPSHSLKRFMLPLQNVTVPAKGKQEVVVTISVPKTAQAGGYYGAVRFTPADTDAGQSVNLSASLSSLILLTVPGPVTENLTMTDFSVQQNGGTASNFRTPDGLQLYVRFLNKGNIQEAPFGQIYVQKGKKTLYTYNFNAEEPRANILPDSARRWTIPLKGFGKFGKYTVGATLGYGSKGQSISITKTVWIIPTAYIFGAIIALVVLVLIVGGAWFFLRAYKRKILRSSRRRY